MANNPTSNLVYDILTNFGKGVNMGLDPFIVPKDQLTAATNVTTRGDFATNRSVYSLMNLSFPNAGVASGMQSGGLFQGAGYFAPDTGSQMLIAQIGGRLFTFTPSANISGPTVVSEVTIPGDPNPTNISQAWFLQAERWMVVNNGVSNNIAILDGVSASRLNPLSVNIGNMTTALGTPPIGATIAAPVTNPDGSPYTGPANIPVQLVEYDLSTPPNVIATTTYFITNPGSGSSSPVAYTLVLTNLNDTFGTPHSNGAALLIEPSNLGTVVSGNVVESPFPIFNGTIVVSVPFPASISVGNAILIASGPQFQTTTWTITSISTNRTTIGISADSSKQTIYTINYNRPNDQITTTGAALPNTQVGTLASASPAAPAVGVNMTVSIESAFNQPVGTIVFLDGAAYQVNSIPAPTQPGVGTLYLENLNDSRASHTFNTGTNVASVTNLFTFPQLPPGRMMAYSMGRIWESLPNGLSFIAGDIVGGSSGSPAFNYRDGVLNASENTFLAGGGSFSVPSNLGQIAAMKTTAQLDASLGQGPLMVVCPNGVFSVNAPADRTTWASLTYPIVSESLIGLGGLSQDTTLVANGDLLFRSVDGIRSLLMARRDFWSWGNAPISFEVQDILDGDNVALLPFGSAVQFDNRMLMTCTPTQGPLGVYHPGLISLNFDPVSSLQGKEPSVYDGLWQDLNILKVLEGQFNGVHRCFAFVLNSALNQIQLVEIMRSVNGAGVGYLDNGITPVTWKFETPAVFNRVDGKKEIFDLVGLDGGEFYVGDIQPGQTVAFVIEYKPDLSSLWFPWHSFSITNPSVTNASFGARLGLPRPTSGISNTVNSTDTVSARWFLFRFTITGHCVFYGVKAGARMQPETEFARVIPKSS